MLVLGRKESESITFPALGIKVCVVSSTGKSIKLGVEAPPEVRVVRSELPIRPSDYFINGRSFDDPNDSPMDVAAVQRQLDTANMALHLAQACLRQGAEGQADDSLVRAIAALEQLEALLSEYPGWCQADTRAGIAAVKENSSTYSTGLETTWMVTCPETGQSAERNRLRRAWINEAKNYWQQSNPVSEMNHLEFLERLQNNNQRPHQVLIESTEHTETPLPPISVAGLRSFCPTSRQHFGGLQLDVYR